MYLIVGVDPGTTTGIAALDFRGGLVDLFSSKDLSRERVIERLIKLGRVSIIATDVTPTPAFVSKLAAQLGAIINTPYGTIPVSEKIRLTRPHKPEDSHQRDALAAALITMKKFKNKFQKIDSLNLGDDVKHLVLQGNSMDDSLNMLRKEEKPEVTEEPKPREDTPLSEGERRMRRIEKQNATLKKQLDEKDEEIIGLKVKISEIKNRYRIGLGREKGINERDQIIKILESSIRNLKNKLKDIDKLMLMWKLLSEGKIKPIAVFPESYKGLTLIKGKLRKKDLGNLDGIKLAFVSRNRDYEILGDRGILVADANYVRETAGCYYINADDLEKLKSRSVSVERIVEDYRNKRPS